MAQHLRAIVQNADQGPALRSLVHQLEPVLMYVRERGQIEELRAEVEHLRLANGAETATAGAFLRALKLLEVRGNIKPDLAAGKLELRDLAWRKTQGGQAVLADEGDG